MVERNPFTDQQIQDYIDGRLGERDRAAVAAYLLAHPRAAADVEAVRRQSDALRALGMRSWTSRCPRTCAASCMRAVHSVLLELRPDPPATRQPASHVRGFLKIVAALLLFCTGGAAGWFAHGVVRPAPTQEEMRAEINRVYTFYGARD